MTSAPSSAPPASPAAAPTWLRGLIACALDADAAAVRAVLREERVRLRSVPAGRARRAWSGATGGGSIAVVVTGRGVEAAKGSASFWMPRSRLVAVVGTAEATGLAPSGVVVAGGVPGTDLRPDPSGRVVVGRIAGVGIAIESEQARASLAGIGVGGTDCGESDIWRLAAAAAGATYMRYHGLVEGIDLSEQRILPVPAGATGVPVWRSIVVRVTHPSDWRRLQQAARAREDPRREAARAAVRGVLQATGR